MLLTGILPHAIISVLTLRVVYGIIVLHFVFLFKSKGGVYLVSRRR